MSDDERVEVLSFGLECVKESWRISFFFSFGNVPCEGVGREPLDEPSDPSGALVLGARPVEGVSLQGLCVMCARASVFDQYLYALCAPGKS